ncbi:MAG: DegT/DnrJ/EryC1/StrS family aminotransferase, partial [Myxococcales bacterium]
SEELDLVREVLASGTLNCTKGTKVKAFEEAFAGLYGVPHARAVSSGTAAVHCAISAIDPEPGDEIITTPVTDMGALTPIIYEGAIPVFADVDPVSLNITPESVAARVTERTKAIIVTHLFGNPCDMRGIMEVARRTSIPVIEDCAQAFLATVDGRPVGTIGEIGAFSLQQGKHITTGEGGVVISTDDAWARHVRLFSDKAWGYGDPSPDHYFLALNYRMTDLQGAVALAQLAKLSGIVDLRSDAAARLTARLDGIEGITLPRPIDGANHVYWKYPLIVDPRVIPGGADALGGELQKRGLACAPRYIQKPAFQCQVFRDLKTFGSSRWPFSLREGVTCGADLYDEADFPGTREGLASVVVLPWNELYTDEHLSFIEESIVSAVEILIAGGRQASVG